ncbi:5865_t:CDS:1 [Acaulospora colombiana]|uniref:5865_t:CDS:1 n=1 Tax=Acaulospora colombiana TaxID=27376 RepID=A0ACA9PTF4_9GLOM|nr:5865_t:CDS:1 [Acaulospora colombiana]
MKSGFQTPLQHVIVTCSPLSCWIISTMANVANLADKLSELTIKQDTTSSGSATSSKLASKYQGSASTSTRAPPGTTLKLLSNKSSASTLTSATNTATTSNATANKTSSAEQDSTKATSSTVRGAPPTLADIGTYDGGFESEMDGGRGAEVDGEAAEQLALDSSTSR